MSKVLLPCIVLLVVLTTPVDAANIYFDEYPLNTAITNQYANLGVVFDQAYIELDGWSAHCLSGENETPNSGVGAPAAPITARFLGPTHFVRANSAYLDAGTTLRIDAYDEAGNLIGTTQGTGEQAVYVVGIWKAVFSFINPNNPDDIACLDDLSFAIPSIDGYITDTSGNPVQDAYLLVVQQRPIDAYVQTDASGYFWVFNLSPGTYWVVCFRRGYRIGVTQVEVSDGVTADASMLVTARNG